MKEVEEFVFCFLFMFIYCRSQRYINYYYCYYYYLFTRLKVYWSIVNVAWLVNLVQARLVYKQNQKHQIGMKNLGVILNYST